MPIAASIPILIGPFVKFKSDLKWIASYSLPMDLKQSQLPQLYRSDMEWARSHKNSDLNEILDNFTLLPGYKYCSIDLRTHNLMKDMWPCIPGWHCDDFYRTEELSNQPDLENLPPMIHHMMVMGNNSKTEFLLNDPKMPSPKELQNAFGVDFPIYYHYDKMIEDSAYLRIAQVTPGSIYTFGGQAFHRGVKATHAGWRTFLRITQSNHREPKNQLRYQTQVYIDGRISW